MSTSQLRNQPKNIGLKFFFPLTYTYARYALLHQNKKNNPVENRSNFLRSERLQFFAYFISCTDAQRSSQIHLRCLWDEITESWRIMVSFMLSLSCKDTIVIIKRKLSRTNTIHGHSYEMDIRMDIRMKLFSSLCKSYQYECQYEWNRKKRWIIRRKYFNLKMS